MLSRLVFRVGPVLPTVCERVIRVVRPLERRDFRLFWIGQAASALGGPLQTVALSWLVLDLTGSAVALSGMLLAATLPAAALTLVGGLIVDRSDPRTVMAWSDASRAILTGLIAVLDLGGALPLWTLYLLLALVGAVGGVYSPAAQSIVPRLTASEQLEAANSLTQSTPQIALLAAAPLGGALVARVGPGWALSLNAVSFAVAAITDLALTPLSPSGANPRRQSLLQGIRSGMAYICACRWLLTLVAVDGILSFAVIGPLAIGLPLLARTRLVGGPEVFGLLLAAFGGGSVAGMFLAGARPPRKRRGVVFCVLQLCQGPLVASLACAPLATAGVALAAVGLLNGVAIVVYLSLVQSRVASEMMGRVMSFVMFGALGLVPLSQLIAGIAAEREGLAVLFVAAGTLMIAAATAGLLSPPLRRID